MEIRHILAPTDLSVFSKQAIEYASALAQTLGAKLSLLYVIEKPDLSGVSAVPLGLAKILLEDLERQSKRELARLLPEDGARGVEVDRQVVVGTPYRKIVQTAAAEKVDLIVMATHGRTGLGHLFMGSVAERVVRTAPCPVLTVRASAVAA